MIFKPLTLKPAVLLVSLAIMLGSVAVAQHLKPSKYWADHTGEPDYEKLIPHHFGEWEEVPYANRGVVNPVQEENLKRIYSQTFARTFVHKPTGRGIMLSIAYGRDQTNDTQLHTPDQCYPSQGFRVEKRDDVDLASPDLVQPREPGARRNVRDPQDHPRHQPHCTGPAGLPVPGQHERAARLGPRA